MKNKLKEEHGCEVLEASAKTGKNVTEAFASLSSKLIESRLKAEEQG